MMKFFSENQGLTWVVLGGFLLVVGMVTGITGARRGWSGAASMVSAFRTAVLVPSLVMCVAVLISTKSLVAAIGILFYTIVALMLVSGIPAMLITLITHSIARRFYPQTKPPDTPQHIL